MKYLVLVSFLYFLIGCKNEHASTFYKIVNSNFINFTDTAAYQYGTFFPAPQDSPLELSALQKPLQVLIDTHFFNTDKYSGTLISELNSSKLTAFIDVVNAKQNNEHLNTIDLSKINETGKYKLIGTSITETIGKNYVGAVSFGRPYILGDKAIIIVSVTSSPKAGRTIAFLLNQIENKWKIQDRIKLEVW